MLEILFYDIILIVTSRQYADSVYVNNMNSFLAINSFDQPYHY